MGHGSHPDVNIDIDEKGAARGDEPQRSNRRLFMQLYAFGKCRETQSIRNVLSSSQFEAVLYRDLNDPQGIAVVLMHENPDFFTREAREFLSCDPFAELEPKPELTMFGRTYSMGREPDLEDWLLQKPRRTVLNPEWTWAIWYPLRRKAEFELLEPQEQGKILYEHARIGMGYGNADFAHDVRLACHGLDRNDNEFVIGLVGKELYPLSRVIQEMRKTQQTAKYIQSLGPFFIGKVEWQTPPQKSGN